MQDSQLVADLCARVQRGERLKYVFFWGHQSSQHSITSACFSQWYGAPFVVDGDRYRTAEHFMMAAKARLFGDNAAHAKVLAAPTAGAAKAIGREVKGFNEQTWVTHRYEIVVSANQAKFSQNADLKAFLLGTGQRVLAEASPVDRIWGIGLAANDDRATNPKRWRGLNLLGFALMDVRARLEAA